MEENKQPVETNVEPAGTQEGVKTDTPMAPQELEVDYQAKIQQLEEEKSRLEAEKENYRKGLLKAKGKLPEDSYSDPYAEPQSEQLEEIIDRKVTEKLLSTREAQINAEREGLLAKVLRQNEELRLAMRNKQSAMPSASGSNQEKPEVQDSYFTPEQLASIKARGLDPEKVKANMLKSQNQPRVGH